MAEWRDVAESIDSAKTVRGTVFNQSGEQSRIATWADPKSDYVAGSQVTPAIFNNLAENEKHLKEITCNIELKTKANEMSIVNNIVLVEV